MTSRDRFLAACHCQPVDRVPAWVMRQAGRYLPEYRALKEKRDFLTMVRTPELAAEVTLQPIRRFAGLDAAILFSDILTIPEALGQGYSFNGYGRGIAMDFALDSPQKIANLRNVDCVPEHLNYMAEALRIVRDELGNSRAILGFAGAPWTLATYMVEGGSAHSFSKIKCLAAERPSDFEALMIKISDAVAASLNLQILAGADVVQIFDSWAALCPAGEYENLSLYWIRRIISALPKTVPVIVFAKGMTHLAPQIVDTGARVLGIDWTQKLSNVRRLAGSHIAVQGNLDPVVLNFSNEKDVRSRTCDVLREMHGENGFIFNLGHGILPEAKPENLVAMLDEIASFSK